MKIEKVTLKYENYEPLECKIPCSLFSALYESGRLPHPYRDDNERLYIEAAKKNCLFEAEFDFIPEDGKSYVLTAECVDTISKIYLNGKYVGGTDNAFYPKKIELGGGAFNTGRNLLQIKIFSPVEYLEEKAKKHYTDSQMDTPKTGLFGRANLRKPQYSFGWDWGAALPDMGLYAPITIEEKRTELERFVVRQSHGENRVLLSIASDVPCECTLYDPNGEAIGRTHADVGGGEIVIRSPRLWWCNNLGDQPLYTLKTEYVDEYSGNTLTDERTIGLRTIEISQEKDEYGRSFGFVLNGKPVFAMGANYIPEEHIVPWLSEEKTERLLQKCKEANFNMLRVWGGGWYASERFYALCDRLGLIVWQDCAFACQSVYLTESFEKSVRAELEYQIRRIARHPSLGLICGNNELEAMIADRAQRSYAELLHRPWLDAIDYLKLFEHIIPDICERYAPDVFYWSCSPSNGGGFYAPHGLQQNENFGDSHLWSLWVKDKPLDHYKNFYPRFCSEFGFLSYPNAETLACFSEMKIRGIADDAVRSHFKRLLYCPDAQEQLEKRIEETFGKAGTLSKEAENSQRLQGRMLKGFIEHMRIHRDRCRGSLYWQLNDPWQSVSWSTVDYYGNEKLSHRMVKEAYAPVIVATERTGKERYVYVSNESRQDFEGTLVVNGQTKKVFVAAFSSRLEAKLADEGASVACRLYDRDGTEISRYPSATDELRENERVRYGASRYVKNNIQEELYNAKILSNTVR